MLILTTVRTHIPTSICPGKTKVRESSRSCAPEIELEKIPYFRSRRKQHNCCRKVAVQGDHWKPEPSLVSPLFDVLKGFLTLCPQNWWLEESFSLSRSGKSGKWTRFPKRGFFFSSNDWGLAWRTFPTFFWRPFQLRKANRLGFPAARDFFFLYFANSVAPVFHNLQQDVSPIL